MRVLMLLVGLTLVAARMSAGQVFLQPSTLPAPPPGDCCQSPCACCQPPCLKTICVPERTTVKTTRAIYDVKVTPYCLPKCPLWPSWLMGGAAIAGLRVATAGIHTRATFC